MTRSRILGSVSALIAALGLFSTHAQAASCNTLQFHGAPYASACSQTLPSTDSSDHIATTAWVNAWATAKGFIVSVPVPSVAGRTGAITLSHGDITDWGTSTAGFLTSAPVPSVAGRTGAIVLSHSDISDWSASVQSVISGGPINGVTNTQASDASQQLATDQFVSLAWYYYAGQAGYVGLAQMPTITYTASNATKSVTLPGYMARVMNVLDMGVAQNAYSYSDAQMAAGSNVLYSPSANFTALNVGNAITVTGTGTQQPNGYLFQSQTGTITGVTDSHHVTTSFTAVNAVPNYGIISSPLASNGQDYQPGDWIQPQVTQNTGVTTLVQAQETITDTTVVSAVVTNGGSGITGAQGGADGADGTCYVGGTTGTIKNKKNTTTWWGQVTVVGGSMVAGSTISLNSGGDYVGSPTTPVSPDGQGNTAEPIIPYGGKGCTGLQGGTVTDPHRHLSG